MAILSISAGKTAWLALMVFAGLVSAGPIPTEIRSDVVIKVPHPTHNDPKPEGLQTTTETVNFDQGLPELLPPTTEERSPRKLSFEPELAHTINPRDDYDETSFARPTKPRKGHQMPKRELTRGPPIQNAVNYDVDGDNLIPELYKEKISNVYRQPYPAVDRDTTISRGN